VPGVRCGHGHGGAISWLSHCPYQWN
jgi:hypothetical protein